jgi:tetratricopeptide (TPR) repeat protein
LIAGTAALAAIVAVLLGGVLDEAPRAGGVTPAAVGAQLQSGFAAGDTEALVARLQSQARGRPEARTLALLGLAYQQRNRETADPSYLTRSEGILLQALSRDARSATALGGLASVALSRHDFREALALARRARSLEPNSALHLGAIGDALLELGRYEEAFATFDRMVALKPSLSAYARIAYARELLGRPREAIEAMELALEAAGGRPEPTAWAAVELGKLHFGLGELAAAARYHRAALAALPGYVYALDALARVEAARDRLPQAIAHARRAVESVPLPQFAATLTELYGAAGRKAQAREQIRLVSAIERLLRANGVHTDLETALFDLDHGQRLSDALARARRAHAERPGIEADDVLAWALVRNGRCTEGLRSSNRALRLGTRDALKIFHRGMAERCLGRAEAARASFREALALNPHFSIRWSPVARRYAS